MIYKVTARIPCAAHWAKGAVLAIEDQDLTRPELGLERGTEDSAECTLVLTWPQIKADTGTDALGVWEQLTEALPMLASASAHTSVCAAHRS